MAKYICKTCGKVCAYKHMPANKKYWMHLMLRHRAHCAAWF